MAEASPVIKTLAYFDLFDFPLTSEEVFSYLWQGEGVSEENVDASLKKLVSDKIIGTSASYYFLAGRNELVEKRNRAVSETEKKLRRAKFAAKLIKGIPFLKAVFVCNSVAAETAGKDSDIDFFIIAKEGHLWFVRFFTNLILRFFGLRTSGRQSADRICLSFYVGERHLDLSGLRICEDDIYLAYWLRQLYPVYDPDKILSQIRTANSWVKKYLRDVETLPKESEKKDVFKKTAENILSGMMSESYEKIFKKIQWGKLRPALKKMSEDKNTAVVIREGVLKFHETDARARIREEWIKKIKKYAF